MSARDTLKAEIVAARSPAALAGLALELRQLADELDERAAALRRQDAKPSAERATPRKRHAGPGRAPSAFVRVAHEPWGRDGRPRLRLYVGRALWYAIGSPARMDLQHIAGRIELRAASGDAGMAFLAGKGMPRAFVDGWADVLRLEPGRYAAEVVGGAIVIGAPIE